MDQIELTSCRFCPELVGDPRRSDFHQHVGEGFGSRYIKETDNFVAFPALGQIVPGHLLITTKKHYLCVGYLDAGLFDELEAFLREAIVKLSEAYGVSPVLLEHGALTTSQKAGCCVEHAHIHLVPIDVDIRPQLRSLYEEKVVYKLADLQSFIAKRTSYLFFESAERERFAYDAPIVVSQFLRRLICQQSGLTNRWDWSTCIEPDAIRETLKTLAHWSNVIEMLDFSRTTIDTRKSR